MTIKNSIKKIIVAVVIILIVLTIAIIIGVKFNSASTVVIEETPTGSGEMFYDPEPSESEKLTKKSDIDGLTVAQKEEMGLRWEDGSDSDWDGLTDKEEIEIYGSDPTKTSTAGDLYTDYYKVTNGMDVNKFYDYEGEFVFEFNHTDELIPTPLNAIDYQGNFLNLGKIEEPNVYNETGYPTGSPLVKVPVRLYRVKQFSGNITVDFSKLLEETGKTVDDFDVYIYTTSKEKPEECGNTKVEVSVDGNKATIENFKFAFENCYEIYIADKDTPEIERLVSNAANGLNNVISTATNPISDILSISDTDYETILLTKEVVEEDWFKETGGILTIGNAFLGGYLNIYPTIYYVDMVDEEGNSIEVAIDAITKSWNKYMATPDRIKKSIEMTPENSPNQYKKVSPQKILLIKNACDFLLSTFHRAQLTYSSNIFNKEDIKSEMILTWYTYADWIEYVGDKLTDSEESEPIKVEIAPKSFSYYGSEEDYFPFTNFTTENNPGVCAGIAYYEAYVYNNGGYEGVGSYNSHSWDVTKDIENQTILAKHGLGRYKNENWTDEKSKREVISVEKHWFSDDVETTKRGNIDKSLLTEGEKQFVEMIEGFHEKFNQEAYQPLCTDYTFDKRCTYDRFKKIQSLIDEDQFLILCMGYRDPENSSLVGHALLLTGIDMKPHDNGDGVIELYCADPNKNNRGIVTIWPSEKFTENHEKVEAFDYYYKTNGTEFGSTVYPEYSFSIWTTDYERYL